MKKFICLSIFLVSIFNATIYADFVNDNVDYDFDRVKAREYMKKYWNNYNEEYYDFSQIGGDCTNYASQIMRYAGVPFTSRVEFPTYKDWYYYNPEWGYGRSSTWTSATEFRKYFGDINSVGNKKAKEMQTYTVYEAIANFEVIWQKINIGDVISHGHGLETSYHSQIVYDFSLFERDILVSQHSSNFLERSLYSYLKFRQRAGMGDEYVYIIYM